MSTRDNYFDKLITTYFDRLWSNETYLDGMGKMMKQSFAARQHWNKQLEQFWSMWQLPNQEMQQRTLHGINTLLTEWRFEQEETNDRLGQMEQDIAEMKKMVAQMAGVEPAKAKAAVSSADSKTTARPAKSDDKNGKGGQS